MADLLDLTPDQLLSTTRAVRKRLDFDRPVPYDLIMECVALAQQAPTGSNSQTWHFVVVDDPDVKSGIAALYARAFSAYRSMGGAGSRSPGKDVDPARQAQQQRVTASADYLAENMARSPSLVIPCAEGRLEGAGAFGSILPAAWSFMLAARARGLGTAWTSLHLVYEREAAELLGIPYESVTQTMLTPVAFTKGTDFKPATRPGPETVTHRNRW
jgi:nitroreductase